MPGGKASARIREVLRFIKAQLSSSVATGVDWALLVILIALGVHYLLAVVAGALAGAATDFSVKKWWVFKSGGGRLHGQAARYVGVSAVSAGLNCLLAYGIVDGLRFPKTPGVIAASAAVGFAWNYPMHRFYVFREKSKRSKDVACADTDRDSRA